MDLQPLDKLIIHGTSGLKNARVIGVKTERDGSKTYIFEPLRNDFTPHKNGSRLMRVNSTDIDSKQIQIEKH